MLVSDSASGLLPYIQVINADKSSQNQNQNQLIPFLAGAAIFNDAKLIGTLDNEETEGVLWLRNELRKTVTSISAPDGSGYITAKMRQGNTKLKPVIENGKWKVIATLDYDYDILQNSTHSLNMIKSEVTSMVERKIEQQIRKHIRLSLDLIQNKYKSDILSFGDMFHRKYPKEWREVKADWKDKFSQVDVDLKIKIHIREPGKRTTPAGVPDDEVTQ
ncbi:Ger(x)C family spore germination C-terminal domain-containing protein [Paenibacillus sp. N1-5-1-14]|uniref:Ger(x)C family spore germination C-terminal domain-containing protein n=1 Tax=Paenibacillus radicibacter TaxID=2972488 RepID=UPI002158A44F|nr:Ger(x)C family spore germination C-terminal domain-containing protein [Paenibacillus radicibacter]MCR8643528.1 Ger(x)C family spore germination C-terminal domain-containing protein [Paenibacillus radicibacter]